MKVAVIGLGGVGGYIAASLAKASIDIVGFARGEHLRVIESKGLTVVEDTESWTQKIDARELNAADGYFDVVLFCVKSYDLRDSFKEISPYIDAKTTILSFSNGVGNGDVLRELSDSIVLDGCVYILSHLEKPGVIRKKGKVFAAVFGGDVDATNSLNTLFKKASLRAKTPDDIKTAIWKKYIFISAFATLTSYYDKSVGYVYENHYDEAKALLSEIASVAKAMGINVDSDIEKSLGTASKIPYDSSTSMRLDFQNAKRNELEGLSGYIVNEGRRSGVETPLMSKMYEELLKRCSD